MSILRSALKRLRRQGVAVRMAVAIGLAMAAYAVLVWQQWNALSVNLRTLTDDARRQITTRLRGVLDLEVAPVRAMAVSWTWWDEFITAVDAKDSVWLTESLDPGIEGQGLSGLFVQNVHGQVIHTAGDPAAASIAHHLPVSELLARRLASFHLVVDGQLYSVETGSIHPTKDVARATTPHGMLTVFRLWDASRLERVSRAFGDTIDVLPAADGADVTLPLAGLDGGTVATLRTTINNPAIRALERQGRHHVLLATLFGIGGSITLALAGLVVIGLPLRRLARHIANGDAYAARQLGQRDDELGRVANAIAEAIDQQCQLAVEVRQREQAEDWLREANKQLKVEFEQLAGTEQALREAEMHNALAIQGGNLALWEFSTAESRWVIDRAWLSTLGITIDPSLPELAAWEAAFNADDLTGLHQRLGRICDGSSDTIEQTFRLRRDDGGRIWVMLRGMVVERGQRGEALRLAGSMLDVTRWRELEEQLRQAQKMESIGQLAAGIAHEINTPIQFIGDNTRFITESFTTFMHLREEVKAILASHPDPSIPARIAAAEERADLDYLHSEFPKALEQTLEGVGRVATIVRAMKEFSHPGSVDPVPTDLNHQIENTSVISRNSWKYVANLELRLAPDLPLVPLSIGDFNQVLLNLIVNAAQAIEDAQKQRIRQGQGNIVIATALVDGRAQLTISDDGIGIPAEIRERIYDPFFTTKEVGRGSGQGLTIARSVIVERHKGTIACQSESGKGATFILTLPLNRPEG